MSNSNKRKILPYGSEVIRGIRLTTVKSIAGGGMYGQSHKHQLHAIRKRAKTAARMAARLQLKVLTLDGEIQ